MISYAQNGEDVVLARALPGATGFYVDVGAADPVRASVTKHFYDIGWSGINIDPRPYAIELLREHRPRDSSLQVAAGDHFGRVELYVVAEDPDLSTTATIGRERIDRLGYTAGATSVEMKRLDDILEEQHVTTIDFLKIDVEGGEKAVLEGIDLDRWQPRVVVIEAVEALSHERTDHLWRHLLESKGYQEGCFDGINLFFARREDQEGLKALVPASALDGYETAEVHLLKAELDRTSAYAHKLEEELWQHQETETQLEAYVKGLESEPSETPDEESPSGHLRPRKRPDSALRPARLAIIGSPRTGNTWVRRVLSDALGAVEVPAQHPWDVNWAEIPERFVIQIHWRRSPLLERHLRRAGATVISIARHPLDVILSMLHFAHVDDSVRGWLDGSVIEGLPPEDADPNSDLFLEWACSAAVKNLLSLTPEWWTTPSTVRTKYESLASDPLVGFEALLSVCHLQPMMDVSTAIQANSPSRIHELSAGSHVWKGRPGAWLEYFSTESSNYLHKVHSSVFATLGYDVTRG